MSGEEVSQLRSLAERGCEIICQDVPTGRRYNLEEVLG